MRAVLATSQNRQSPQGLMGGFFFAFFFAFPTIKPLSNLLILILVVLFMHGLTQPALRAHYWETLRDSAVLQVLLALIALIALHALASSGEAEWIGRHLRKYARFLYAVILILMLYGQPFLQRCALAGFVAAMLFTLASTWLNVWFLLPWSETQALGFGQSHHVFGDYITQNQMMALFAGIALYASLRACGHAQRLAWLAVVVLAIGSITHLSLSRTALLSVAAVALCFIAVLVPRRWSLPTAAAVLIGIGLAALSSDTMLERIQLAMAELSDPKADLLSAMGHRLHNYQTTWALIAEKPWLGHGTGAYHTEICRHIDPGYACAPFNWHPHNQFLFLAADHGVIGAALYALLLASLFRTAAQAPDRAGKLMLASISSVLLVNSLFNSPFWSSIESQFFAFMMGLGVAMCLPAQTGAGTPNGAVA